MKEKLTPRQLTLIGSMLFGLFFGAGNLIFPLILGAKAGQNLPAALPGLLITAVGLVISCAGTFETMFPGKLSYPRWAMVFSGASLLISNFGLSRIIEFSAPVLYFLYPLAIVLILLGLFGRFFGHARPVYQWTMWFTLAAAALELCRVVAFRPVAGFARRFLPFYAYGLGWIMPAALGFAVGIILKKMR